MKSLVIIAWKILSLEFPFDFNCITSILAPNSAKITSFDLASVNHSKNTFV